MREKSDLTRKETWRDPEKIAKRFGYEPDENFKNALSALWEQYVKEASVTLYLATIAQRFFGNWEPPLQHVNNVNKLNDPNK